MIDLGLSKLAIIGVVALIVIGPEKLPKVARMAGTLYGRAQRYLHDVKSEVSREIQLDELRNLQKEVADSAAEFKSDVEHHMTSSLQEVESAWHGDIQPSAPAPSASVDDLERKVFGRFGDDTWVYPGHGDDTTLGTERPSLPEWRERGW